MINIITWNIKMLPSPIGKNNDKRIIPIIQELLNIDADIICLQEVFDEEIRSTLIKSLENIYSNIIEKGDISFDLRQDSGLFIASKYKIEEWDFFPFLNGVGWDAISNKGFIGAQIKSEEGNFSLINTHLQADYSFIGQHEDIREKQLKDIKNISYIYNINTSVIITGDFNISAEESDLKTLTPEYIKMQKLLDVKDLFREECPNCNGVTSDPNNPMVDNDEEAQRLDYILTTDKNISCIRTTVLTMNNYSDHFAVYCEIEL